MRIRVLEAIFLLFSKPRRELSWTLKSLLNFQVIYRQAENNLQTSKSHDIVCGFVFPTPEKKIPSMTISKIAQLEKYGVRFQRLLLSHLPFIYSLIKLKHIINDFWTFGEQSRAISYLKILDLLLPKNTAEISRPHKTSHNLKVDT